MAKRKPLPKSRPLTLEQQIYRMQCLHPEFKLTEYRRQSAVAWMGHIRPTPLSNDYTVSISLKQGFNPIVQVLQPALRIRRGATCLPHFYTHKNSLCLHQPHEWKNTNFVAEEIIGWASLWLFFYEIWLITGSWEGEGTHADKSEHKSIKEKEK